MVSEELWGTLVIDKWTHGRIVVGPARLRDIHKECHKFKNPDRYKIMGFRWDRFDEVIRG